MIGIANDGNTAPLKRQVVAKGAGAVVAATVAAPIKSSAPQPPTASTRPPIVVGRKAVPAVYGERATAPAAPLKVVIDNGKAGGHVKAPGGGKAFAGKKAPLKLGKAASRGSVGGAVAPVKPPASEALSLSAKLSMPLERLVKSKA